MVNETTQSKTVASGPDLEKVPVEQALATLAVKPEQGLSAVEAQQRVAKYGPNAIVVKVLSEPQLQATFGLATHAQLQTVMFLQLVGGGQLLLFITRTENWFFQRPYPAAPLLGAIVGTQLAAALMCGFGLLVPAIPWKLIGWVWLYVAIWMFILGGVRMAYDRFASYRATRHQKSLAMVNQSLQPHVPASASLPAA